MKLGIGKKLVEILSENTVLKGKVFPLSASETTFPFAIYSCNQTTADYCKDRRYSLTTASITLNIYAKSYDQSIQLAQAIIDNCTGNINGILDIHVTSVSEDYTEDIYIQSIELTINYR